VIGNSREAHFTFYCREEVGGGPYCFDSGFSRPVDLSFANAHVQDPQREGKKIKIY
jgi:hypothetical protein